MPVSGLLLTIDPGAEPALRATLAADRRTTPGEHIGVRLVVALDTPDRAADEAAWAWLGALPGVRWIDLVWVALDATEPRSEPNLRGPTP